jgi:hypothetical protein
MDTSDAIAKLERACFEIARTTKWVRQPIDSDEIVSLAAQFSEIAKDRIFYGEGLQIDAPLVTRAVQYLGQAHASPPMGDDTQWFRNMLDVLLEIERPNSGLDRDGQAFLNDMLAGIHSFTRDTEI